MANLISDEKFQEDIITKLKSIASVTSLLPDGVSGIKEVQWQGTTFQYPNVRLDLTKTSYKFDEQERCSLYEVEFTVYIFSQERSSMQCSQIKGLLENYLTGLGFTGIYAKYTRLRLVDNIQAFREDSLTCRSQLNYLTRSYPI